MHTSIVCYAIIIWGYGSWHVAKQAHIVWCNCNNSLITMI